MKPLISVLMVLALLGIVFFAGCTGTAPTGTVTQAPGTSTPISTTAPVAAGTTPVPSGKVIIDQRINLLSGYQTTYEKYPFEDYGYQYLYPGDMVKISINADKPVNVLVIDKGDEMKFDNVEPEWNTVLKKDQWDYSPVVPAFSQSNVLRKDMTFTVKDKSVYFLIIDPRFSSEQAGWKGSKHEEVHVDVKVTKL